MVKSRQAKIVNDFTSGSIPRQMAAFALPFMVSNAMQVLYSIVDMIVVGRYVGSFALSAVSVSSQIVNFMTMLCMGFSTGGQVFISQQVGAGDRSGLNRTIGTLFSLVGALAALMTLLGLLLHRPLLALMNTPAESFDMAKGYVLVSVCGIVFTYGYNMVSAVLRGMGDSRHPFIFIMIASVVNLVLDILFVAVFRWGVTGAALATIIGQAVSFIYALFFLYRNRVSFGFDFKPASFRIDREASGTLFRLGVPFALQSCAINISMMFVSSLVNRVGVYASATYGVGIRIDDIINKVTNAISFAISAMVGQNVAAGEHGRAKRVVLWAWVFAGASYLLFTVLLLIFYRPMFSLFTTDQNVLGLAPVFVSAIVWGFPAMALMRGTNGFINGTGNALLGLVLGVLDGFLFRIVFSYVLGITLGLGFYGFVLGFTLAAYGTALPGMFYFFSGKWKTRRLLVRT